METGDVKTSRLDPDGWMRKRFPSVFHSKMGKCFERRRSGTATILSPFRFSLCLGPTGSPDSPIRYSTEAGAFFRYSPREGIYKQVTNKEVERRFFDVLDECAHSMKSSKHVQMVHSVQRPSEARAVVSALQGEGSFPDPTQRRDLRYLHVENGILDIHDLKLLPFSPDRPSAWKVPVAWNPGSPEPVRFREMMDRLFPDSEDRELALEVLASAFLGNPFQRFVLMTGAPGTGKSSLIRMLSALLGPGASGGLRLRHVNSKFTAHSWAGRLLLYAPEVEQSDLNEGLEALKAISGHDPITAERKYGPELTFTPQALPILVSNHRHLRLPAESSGGAVARRLVSFDVPEPDRPIDVQPDFVDRLIEHEGPAILELLLATAHKLHHSGSLRPLTEGQTARNELFLGVGDPLTSWARTHVQRKDGASLLRDEAIPSAQVWLAERHLDYPNSTTGWSRRLKAVLKGAGGTWAESVGERGQGKGWRGLTLR